MMLFGLAGQMYKGIFENLENTLMTQQSQAFKLKKSFTQDEKCLLI